MNHSKIILAIGSLALGISTSAQDELGLRSSNYSGVNRLTLNPAAMVGSPTKWSFNIVGAGVFVNTKYLYLENTNGINALKRTSDIQLSPSLNDGESSTNGDALYLNFYDANKRMGTSLNTFKALPSFVFQKNQKSFGVIFNARAAVSANRVDPDLDYFSVANWENGTIKNIDKLKTAGASWGEVGLHYGQILSSSKHSQLSIGGTVKYLLGTDAYFVKSTALSDITKFTDSVLLSNSEVSYGIATGLNDDLSGYHGGINGHGLALDLGVEYKISSRDWSKPYQWKFSAAILDLGFIRFGKNAQKHRINLEESFDILTESYGDIESIEDLYAINSTEALNDPLQSKVADKFNILTPTGISLQVDYAVHRSFYINATFNRRIRFAGPQVERENFFSLTPRVESKWFEFGLPLVLYNDIEPRIGMWVRLAYLTIGSDNFNSLVFKQERLHGADIYFALNVLGFDREKKGKKSKAKSNSSYGCYY